MLPLPHSNPILASHVHTLDIYPPSVGRADYVTGEWLSDPEGIFPTIKLRHLELPNLKCVRLLGPDRFRLMPAICDPPETVIQLVHPVNSLPSITIGDRLSTRTKRCLAVLPSHVEQVGADSVHWSDEPGIGSRDRFVIFLPELDNIPDIDNESLYWEDVCRLESFCVEHDPSASITVVGSPPSKMLPFVPPLGISAAHGTLPHVVSSRRRFSSGSVEVRHT